MTIATPQRTTAQRSVEFTSAINGALVEIGDKFGLYRALAEIGPSTVGELARATGISGALIGHWLAEQALSDYLYVDENGRFSVYCPIPNSN